MFKRDFESLAFEIRDMQACHFIDGKEARRMAMMIARACRRVSKAFDAKKFYEACGVGE